MKLPPSRSQEILLEVVWNTASTQEIVLEARVVYFLWVLFVQSHVSQTFEIATA